MMKPVDKRCLLCNKELKFMGKRQVKETGMQALKSTDSDTKSAAHLCHVSGRRATRKQFKILEENGFFNKMGITNVYESINLCYDCHEVVLHNPIITIENINKLSVLFEGKNIGEKVMAFKKVIESGISKETELKCAPSVEMIL